MEDTSKTVKVSGGVSFTTLLGLLFIGALRNSVRAIIDKVAP